MESGSIKRKQARREHILVPLVLAMANITLGMVVYVLHQLYVVHLSGNPLLVRTYSLTDAHALENFTNTNLIWATLFTVLLVSQVGSLRVRHYSGSMLVLLASLAALLLWMI